METPDTDHETTEPERQAADHSPDEDGDNGGPGTDADAEDLPEWVPDEYNPDADLYDRMEAMASIEGGIEIHVQDERGVTEIVGGIQDVNQDGHGNYRARLGSSATTGGDSWDYELVVPSSDDHDARLEDVDPDQPHELYLKTREPYLKNVDARIYGVDHDRLKPDEGGVST